MLISESLRNLVAPLLLVGRLPVARDLLRATGLWSWEERVLERSFVATALGSIQSTTAEAHAGLVRLLLLGCCAEEALLTAAALEGGEETAAAAGAGGAPPPPRAAAGPAGAALLPLPRGATGRAQLEAWLPQVEVLERLNQVPLHQVDGVPDVVSLGAAVFERFGRPEEARAAAETALRGASRKTSARWEAQMVLGQLALQRFRKASSSAGKKESSSSGAFEAAFEVASAEAAFEAAASEARRGKTLPALELLAVQRLTKAVLGPSGRQAEGRRRLEEVASARLGKPFPGSSRSSRRRKGRRRGRRSSSFPPGVANRGGRNVVSWDSKEMFWPRGEPGDESAGCWGRLRRWLL